jgi:hypothetical protein
MAEEGACRRFDDAMTHTEEGGAKAMQHDEAAITRGKFLGTREYVIPAAPGWAVYRGAVLPMEAIVAWRIITVEARNACDASERYTRHGAPEPITAGGGGVIGGGWYALKTPEGTFEIPGYVRPPYAGAIRDADLCDRILEDLFEEDARRHQKAAPQQQASIAEGPSNY